MRLASIQITNLAAFKEFKSDLPAVCLLEGKNGVGKSSIERVVMYAMGRRPMAEKGSRAVQHDPGMLHGDAESGSVVITFSEDSPAEFLRCVVKPDGTERKVKMRGAKKWEDANSFIEDITSALAYDPMRFRDLTEKERIEAFLRIAPVDISAKEFSDAVGGVMPVPDQKPGLESINSAYDAIFSARTLEKGSADRLSKHAAELESTLGPTVEGDWADEVVRLRVELDALKLDANTRAAAIAGGFRSFELQAQKDANDEHAAIDAEINQKIRALEAERANRKSVVISVMATKVTEAREEAAKGRDGIAVEVAPKIEDLTARIATAEERSKASVVMETTRRNAKSARDEAEQHLSRAGAMTEALKRLTELKASVGARMKVPGVTIAVPRAGAPVDICREENGSLVPFSRWNDGDADLFCLRMAVLYRGACGLVCIDNMGNWPPDRQKTIIDRCLELSTTQNMQFLIGSATDLDELVITDGRYDKAKA